MESYKLAALPGLCSAQLASMEHSLDGLGKPLLQFGTDPGSQQQKPKSSSNQPMAQLLSGLRKAWLGRSVASKRSTQASGSSRAGGSSVLCILRDLACCLQLRSVSKALRSQFARLRGASCRFYQGFHLAKGVAKGRQDNTKPGKREEAQRKRVTSGIRTTVAVAVLWWPEEQVKAPPDHHRQKYRKNCAPAH